MGEVWHIFMRTFAWAYGPDHELLTILGVFTIIDLVVTKVDDVYRGRWNWGHTTYLLISRLLLWLLVLMATDLNRALNVDPPILRDGVVWFLVAVEGMNALTAGADLGLPIPPQLQKVLAGLISNMLTNEKPGEPADQEEEHDL